MLLCCRMDRVIASILVLIAAFILQYLWQYYRTMTDEDGVALAVDVAEPVTQRDDPQVLSLQVISCIFHLKTVQTVTLSIVPDPLLLILLFCLFVCLWQYYFCE